MFAIVSLFVSFAASQSTAVGNLDLFFGVWGCLAVAENQSLAEGDQLIILAAGTESTEIRVGAVRRPSEVPDCGRTFRADPPSRVASLSLPKALEFGEFFAVRPQRDLLILTGASVKLSAEDTQRWAGMVSASLPARWQTGDVLAHAYRYDAANGQAVIEVYLGLPTLNPPGASPPIQAITIQRFFVANGQMLASQQYERVSGREERVDTEPPRLTLDNWSASLIERTVAFLSDDNGRSWKRLSTNVGFEGIHWIVETLRGGLPEERRWSLYTPH